MAGSSKQVPSRLAMLLGAGTLFALAARFYARRQAEIDFRGRSVLILGGSRGLGLVLGRMLAAEGARVALVARDKADLERAELDLLARDAEVMVLQGDIQDQVQVEQVVNRVLRRYGQIDVLINVAGVIQAAPLEHMRLEDFEQAMGVHFWGPLHAMLAVIPFMREKGGGRIVNITSIGGLVAVPHLAPYTASKFAMVGLSDAFRAELARDGIYVTTVAPGLMRTGSHVNAMFKGRHRLEYTWFSLADALPVTSTSAESAARQIIEACRYGQSHLTITPQARLLALFDRLFPNVSAGIIKTVNRFLPSAEPHWGDITKTGWESQSRWSPSPLTVLADRAAEENNELKGHSPIVEEEF